MLHHNRSATGAHAQRRLSRRFFATAAAGAMIAGGVAAGSVAAAAPAMATASTASCPTVLVIAARGSTEAASPGTGSMGALASLVQGDVKATVGVEAVNYPATLQNYSSSVATGDSAMESDIENALASCPGEKLILMGYSQGGQVVGDALAGGGGADLKTAETAGVPSADDASILAAIMFGDPRHVANQEPIDLGTGDADTGLFPPEADQSRAAFSNILRSWCDTGDPFCASGNNLSAHLDYPQKYDTAANTFIEGTLSAAGIS